LDTLSPITPSDDFYSIRARMLITIQYILSPGFSIDNTRT
jgi:hypothetical protein